MLYMIFYSAAFLVFKYLTQPFFSNSAVTVKRWTEQTNGIYKIGINEYVMYRVGGESRMIWDIYIYDKTTSSKYRSCWNPVHDKENTLKRMQSVLILCGHCGDQIQFTNGKIHPCVNTPNGRVGYVYSAYFERLRPPKMLCWIIPMIIYRLLFLFICIYWAGQCNRVQFFSSSRKHNNTKFIWINIW